MTVIELTFALLALLASPGPTNALLAMAGAQGARGVRLPLLVLATYVATVVPLTLWGSLWLDRLPDLKQGLTVAAGLWVGLMALKLWRTDQFSLTEVVSPAQIGLTTLLNPKALVFGLVLLPTAPNTAVGFGLFGALVLAVSTLWLRLGASLPHRARPMVNRGGAVWLGLLAAVLLGRVFSV
jgi:threonine/homoserine/homoserine lactone efflux protein